MKEKKIEINELEQLGLESLKQFWGLENGFIETMTNKQVAILIKKASLGMQFYRENNVNRRSIEQNTIRVCTMLAKDKNELQRLLKESVPQYVVTK